VERVVLVTIDTLRADRVGSYGGDPEATPRLDALGLRGTRFETAISPVPLTLPSHTTILSGRDPLAHGVHANSVYRVPADLPTLAGALRAQGLATAAFLGAVVLDRRFGLARDFDRYDDQMEMDSSSRGVVTMAERRGDRVVESALAWLEGAPERFFLWVHLYDPHADYRAPEPFASRFRGRPYLGEIAFADAQVGRLLDALAARFGPAGTLVAVTSDHGESLGEHGEVTHSYTLHDATQRVPLWLAGPGVPAGRVVRELVRLEDLAPTLLALAGAPPLAGATGASLVPLLEGAPAEPRAAYQETLAGRLDYGWSPLFGVRTARHRYVRAPRPELYDLEADPGELRNLADAEPARRGELEALLERVQGGRVPGRPNFVPDGDARGHLEALGYVVPAPDPGKDLARIEGTDPKDGLAEVEALNEANGLMSEEKPREALAALARIPGSTFEIELLRGMAWLGLSDPAAAGEAARKAIADAPGRAAGYLLLSHVHEAEGRLDAALEAIAAAERVEPDSSGVAVARGRLAEARGARDEAAGWYRRGRETRIPSSEAHWRLAALAIERRDFAEADALLAPVPAHELRRSGAAGRLASAELAAGRLDLALLRADAGLRDHPDASALLALKAQILEESGRLAEALALRERLLSETPDDAVARNAVAWNLGLLGRDLERAASLARGVVDDTGGDPGALDTLAMILLVRGELRLALRLVERGVAKAGGETRTLLRYRRAEVLAALGERQAAEDALREARSDPVGSPRSLLRAELAVKARLDDPGARGNGAAQR
jgi:arylsulfatase A-like enzyme/tetratricopeptide (TPR) repeat protein